MKAVNFKVLGIEKAEKENFVVLNVKFNNSDKVYGYVRRSEYDNDSGNLVSVIDGTQIFYAINNDGEYEVVSLYKKWDTKRKARASTVGNGNRNGEKKIAEELKQELEQQNITPITPIIPAPAHKNGEVHHKEFDTIKTCIENDIPVYLAGPAGSGKNHTLEQIAKELKLDFYFTNSVQQEYKLTGFIDAGGVFHETEFYKAFKNGGVFFLDEMDASIPEVLVLLNAAIANRYFEFPNGKITANENFRVVAAGNTVGSGADENYTGRMVLDQATLDRFTIIEFDYDTEIELHLAKGNTELVDFIENIRKVAEQNMIRATFSYRCITMVTKLEGKLELEKILLIAVVKGMTKDTINILGGQCDTNNKYGQALNKIAA